MIGVQRNARQQNRTRKKELEMIYGGAIALRK